MGFECSSSLRDKQHNRRHHLTNQKRGVLSVGFSFFALSIGRIIIIYKG